MSERQCQDHLGRAARQHNWRQFLHETMAKKTDISRGYKCSATNVAYKIYGMRHNSKSSCVGCYAFNKGVIDDNKQKLNEKAEQLCSALEAATE